MRHSTHSPLKAFRLPLALVGALLFCCTACARSYSHGSPSETTPQRDTITTFTFPAIPSTLQQPEERAAYLISHYWQHIDFADTNYVHHPDIMEQAWVNYIDLMPFLAPDEAARAMSATLTQASASKPCLLYMAELADKYLYDPNSPMRNEELYIPVLRVLSESPLLDEAEKVRPRARLELALKNRPGTVATDFTYTLASGRTSTLHATPAPLLLLFINNPDCHTCNLAKEELTQAPAINQALRSGRLTILSLYPDEELDVWKQHLPDYPAAWLNAYDATQALHSLRLYDLKAIPTLYLLDAEKRILLKDASVQMIEEFLE